MLPWESNPVPQRLALLLACLTCYPPQLARPRAPPAQRASRSTTDARLQAIAIKCHVTWRGVVRYLQSSYRVETAPQLSLGSYLSFCSRSRSVTKRKLKFQGP